MRKKHHPLLIEPTRPFVIDPIYGSSIQSLWLVGVGGTGGLLAASLARMLYHFAHGAGHGDLPRVILIDGDTVEEGNIGRQNFSPWDVGFSKAEILAARYNTALGTRLEAIHAYFSSGLASEICDPSALRHTLLVSAVDTNSARREIAWFLQKIRTNHGIKMLWADVGNTAFTGQLVVGNTIDPTDVQRSFQSFRRKKQTTIDHLPSVMLVHPEMWNPDEDPPVQGPARLGCAAAVEQDVQSLPVNSMAAQLAANAVYSVLKFRRLDYFAVFFNCRDNFARPLYNTKANFQRILANARLVRRPTSNGAA